MQLNKVHKKEIISILLLLIVGVGYYFLNKYFHVSLPCIFHEITGFYCPGCGITRLFFSLLKLEFYQAFRYNPLVFILLMGYIIYKIVSIFKKNLVFKERYVYMILGVVILFGILRNISTFEYLLPTEI